MFNTLTAHTGQRCGQLIALCLILGLCCGCLSGRRVESPNILIIVVDTLRADHLGCYGYTRPTSPRIDKFAGRATRYTRAYAPSPWTLPSHASLFTGKYSFQHGVHSFKPKNRESVMKNVHPLPLEALTLAEALQDAGYRTGAFAANDGWLTPRWQLNQGFETFASDRVWSKELNRRIFPWLEEHAGRPFFLFVNYIDTHRPYNTTPRPGLLDRPAIRDNGELLDELSGIVLPGTMDAPPELAQQVIDQFDTGIANVDQAIGELLDRVTALGLGRDTLIVITSDHGEFFGEHRLVAHSKDVYEEVLRIPLILRSPGQQTGRIDERPVSLADVPRLIFSEIEVPVSAASRQALQVESGPRPLIAENYYARGKDLFGRPWSHRFDRIRTSIHDWPYKYIQSSDGNHELYNLERDRGEEKNLLLRERAEAERLARVLEEYLSTRPMPVRTDTQPPLSPDEIDKLRALGYAQ